MENLSQTTVNIIIGAIGVLALVGLVAGFVLVSDGKPGGEFVTIGSTGLGALAALLASLRTGKSERE